MAHATHRIKYSDLITSLENMPAPSEASIKDPTEQEDEIQESAVAGDMVGAKPEGKPVTGLDSEANRKLGPTGTTAAPTTPAKVNDKTMGTDAGVDQTANEGKSGKAPEGVTVKGDTFDPARPAQENIVEPEGESVIPSQTVGGDPEAVDIEAASDELVEGSSADDILVEAEETADDLARFETVAEALEKYQGILARGIAARGYVSSETAAAIRTGLEAFSPELFKKAVPGLEGFRHPIDRVTVSNELAANLAEGAKKAGAYAFEALKKLWQLLVDLYESVANDAQALIERLNQIDANAANVGKANKDKMAIRGAARLTINGQFSAAKTEGLKALRDVAQELLVDWPSSLADAMESIRSGRESDTGKGSKFTDWISVLNTEIKKDFKSAKPIPDGQTPGDFSDFDLVYRSALLPGDYALFVGVQDQSNVENLSNGGLKIKVERVEGASAGEQGEFVVDVPNPAEMKGMTKALREILTSILTNGKNKESLSTLARVISRLGTGTQFAALVEKDGSLSDLGHAMKNVASMSIQTNRMFTGYLYNTVKAHIAVLEAFVGHHENKGENTGE